MYSSTEAVANIIQGILCYRYEAMSRIYYRGAKAAIVCYDVANRNSWDRAKFWINELRRFEEVTC